MPDINMQVFEEVKRNQLVTEVDIQTQAALDDYQVQLSDVDNPTKSQDNVVIDRFGEFLPHWNESLDFDTWVKMQIESSGKRVLLIHGNDGLSSASSGDDTFIQWHGVATAQFLDSLIDPGENYIVEQYTKVVSFPSTQNVGGMTDNLALTGDVLNFQSALVQDWVLGICKNNGTETYVYEAPNLDVGVLYRLKIVVLGTSNVYHYANDNMIESGITTNIPDANMGLFMAGSNINQLWSFVRKYTATEPTYTISTPKNISTALKSFGRAG